ncbi:Translocation protein S62 [Massospora cicadina]|nr:Translocation protein S62 [Massospora cicadina]
MSSAKDAPPKEVIELANFLLDAKKSGLRARQGKLNGQRVIYFKGKSGINAIRKPAYATGNRACPETREAAAEILRSLTKALSFIQSDTYDENSYYVWLYQGSQLKNYLMGILVLVGIFAGVLFPLWPAFMRNGAWYVSMAGLGFIGFLFVTTIVRFILYIFTKIFYSPGIWLFPNLYEDVGFFESFVPLYAWDLPPPPKKPKVKPSKKAAAGKVPPQSVEPLLVESNDPSADMPPPYNEEAEEIQAEKGKSKSST